MGVWCEDEAVVCSTPSWQSPRQSQKALMLRPREVWEFEIELELVSLQTQIPFNFQTKIFKSCLLYPPMGIQNFSMSFLLAFTAESSGSPWKEIGDNFWRIFSRISALKRVLEEHWNVAQVFLQFFYFYVNGGGK